MTTPHTEFSQEPALPGVHYPVARADMAPAIAKLRDAYARVPGAPLFQREFGYYCLDAWAGQGMPQDVPLAELFGYDPPAHFPLGELGWCEAAFDPLFEEITLEERGELEVIQDTAGRSLLVFKGRRSGFMPEYLDHPVKDRASWEENVKWRLDPAAPSRYASLESRMQQARAEARTGKIITQNLIGGYMYLRSLFGPESLLYALYDDPELIHECMLTWLELADRVIASHQSYITLDEVYLAEDICFNHGPLISPAMMEEFLWPYYQELLSRVRSRQLDPQRHLHVHIDTDGNALPVIPLYQKLGMDVMSPFEVAAGCDVVAIGRAHPGLAIFGGIDKRILAQDTSSIDQELERILPAMRARGGYIPTCDHGVPAEVPYANYLYYRKRCLELGS